MNSLEFIEKIIENLKEILKGIDNRIQDEQNYQTLLAHSNEEKKHFEKELSHFQQIKAELEAWGVVKKRLIREKYGVFHSKDCSVHNYTRIYLKEIKEDENTEEYQKLKKSLEVEDE